MTSEEINIIGKLIKESSNETREQLEAMETRIEDKIASLVTEVREIRNSQVESDQQFIEFKAETKFQIKYLTESRDKFGERLGQSETKIASLSSCIDTEKAVEHKAEKVANGYKDRFRFWTPVIVSIAAIAAVIFDAIWKSGIK
jgi:hypothetical protein